MIRGKVRESNEKNDTIINDPVAYKITKKFDCNLQT